MRNRLSENPLKNNTSEIKKLLVIIPDRLSRIVAKGSIIDRYYNPGEFFDEVHILMTNDDRPDEAIIQKTVGRAQLFIYRLPCSSWDFLGACLWKAHPAFYKALKLAQEINPHLVRCYGSGMNVALARRIKQKLGVPYVVSLHMNPDVDVRPPAQALIRRVFKSFVRKTERQGLSEADLVLPVYQSIVPYLDRIGVRNYRVAYNVLNPAHFKRKTDYELKAPVRIVCVGRQMHGKNPSNILKAVSRLENCHLTFFGDGILRDDLVKLSNELGISSRVTFRESVSNDLLCATLSDFDIFVNHSDFWEFSKSIQEALYAGLPVLTNYLKGNQVPELTDDICLRVENTVEGYHSGLERLMRDRALRADLGRTAGAWAEEWLDPSKTESHYQEIYEFFTRPKESRSEALQEIK